MGWRGGKLKRGVRAEKERVGEYKGGGGGI